MRISDWSSDVCSSDLLVGVARLASRWRRPEAPDVRRASRPEEADVLLALSALTVLAVLAPLLARLGLGRELGYVFAAGFAGVAILIAFHVPQILDGGTVETSVDWLPSLGVSFALRLHEIGRASCRERVCQYV